MEATTFYKGELHSSRFDKNTVTVKVKEDFWRDFQVRKGVVYLSVGGGIMRIKQQQSEQSDG